MTVTLTLLSLFLGAVGGAGLWCLASLFRSRGRGSLLVQVAPWVSDLSLEAHSVAIHSIRRQQARGGKLAERITSRIPERVAVAMDGGSATARLRAQAGLDLSTASWRVRVLEAGALGSVVGFIVGVMAVVIFHASVVSVVALAVTGLFAGVMGRRWLLARGARLRVARILDELPALCELLAICLSAGEGFREALARVVAHSDGPLASELQVAIGQAELGKPLTVALSDLSDRLDIVELRRTLDHIISSIDRGTPLADVLRTQASEARAEAGRRLQERASAREVVMLIPLIFLILPITIAFAIFPGLLVIQSGL